MRFLKMRWVKVTGLFLLGLLPAVLIMYFEWNPYKKAAREFLSNPSKKERWKNSGSYTNIIYQTEVKWGGWSDGEPPKIGKDVYVTFRPSDVSLIEIHDWKVDKPLTLAYSRAEGVMLIDPLTKKFARIRAIRMDHPIDAYLELQLNKPSGLSTQGMVEAYDRAIDLWELEIKRIDDEILSKKYFTGEIRENYLKHQKARNDYIETMNLAVSDFVNFDPSGGTINRVHSEAGAYGVIRDAALNSMTLANFADDFDTPGNNNPRRE